VTCGRSPAAGGRFQNAARSPGFTRTKGFDEPTEIRRARQGPRVRKMVLDLAFLALPQRAVGVIEVRQLLDVERQQGSRLHPRPGLDVVLQHRYAERLERLDDLVARSTRRALVVRLVTSTRLPFATR
jgi:hypothetical protein